MRIIQPAGTRGSLKWMQGLASRHAHLLDEAIRVAGGLQPGESIRWVSPCEADAWAEYRDAAFLARVGQQHLAEALARFWPRGGPQWDALGVGDRGTILLVEAKAHLSELASTCQASPASRERIAASLELAKAALGASSRSNWLEGFYQYANRLAHLHFFQSHGIPAKLVFVYFTNDAQMNGPASEAEWKAGLAHVYRHLGLPTSGVPDVINVFIDSSALA